MRTKVFLNCMESFNLDMTFLTDCVFLNILWRHGGNMSTEFILVEMLVSLAAKLCSLRLNRRIILTN